MTTLSELKAWLKKPGHIRRILIEINDVVLASSATPVADQNLASSYVGTTTQYVTQLYTTYFLRQPDSGGLSYWVNLIDRSILTKRQVEQNFLGGEGSTTTFYLSNGAYTSYSTDSPANKSYTPIVIGGVSFTESMSLDNSISLSYGDIELDNTNGVLDSYLSAYIWANKSISIYLGDPSWTKANFKLLFKGIIRDIASRDRKTLNLLLGDAFQKLNTSVTEETVTITSKNNVPELVPLTFGECFNLTPLLVNSSTLTYQVHNGPVEDIIEVRDNGIPVEFTKDLLNGKFTLSRAPFGQITCSVQGHKPSNTYTNKIGETIKNILTGYGPSDSRLVVGDLDTANFTNFDSSFTVSGAYKRPIGIYLKDKDNVLTVCNELAKSARGQLSVAAGPQESDSSVGLIKLVKLEIGSVAAHTITGTDIVDSSINISEKVSVKAATKIGYCKNWTVQQSGLAAGVPVSNQSIFNTEYMYATSNNEDIRSYYGLSSEVAATNTLLITKEAAEAESYISTDFWSKIRYIYTMNCYAHLFDVQLGDTVSLTNRRFLLDNKLGVVVSVSRDWIAGRVQIGVLV
jgi:hypothetical protein